MNDDKYIIASMALDLKRVALGFHNGSINTGRRFLEEALKRKSEINEKNIESYLNNFLQKLPKLLDLKDNKRIAEDALMYSTIFQNYALYKK